MSNHEKNNGRRKFLKTSALGGAFLGLTPAVGYSKETIQEQFEKKIQAPKAKGKSVMGLKVDPIKQVRVAFIGVGNRGTGHVRNINALHPKAKIVAICDVRRNLAQNSIDYLKKNGQKKVDIYTDSEDAWKTMLQRDDIDLVIISTPWKQHVPMSVYAMEQGKHVALEVPAAYTLEGCWKLVNTAEETQRNCMMMENVCYGDEELWVLNMANQGIFGDLTYAEAAYIHDLRYQILGNSYYENWRAKHHITSDGNLYPTHGLGPVAQYLGIGRGDRFNHLVSMSSLEAGLTKYANEKSDPNHEYYKHTEFAHGDMNNALIKTHKGRTILLQHDVVTPRPYSRINALAGTKGYHEGYPSRLALDEKGAHNWLSEADQKEMKEQYRHSIWNTLKTQIEKYGGHGGMDFIMIYRLIDNLNKGIPLDMDVYDGVDWSVVTPLSVTSVALGSIPVKFPDFTRGKWKENRKLEILKAL